MTDTARTDARVAPAAGSRPLDGVVVLDLTRYLSGPYCTQMLAALGAEVIKIDAPSGGDPLMWAPPFVGPQGVALQRRDPADIGLAYLKRARGKRSVTLDIRQPDGMALLLELVDRADVLVENFRVGATARLGIDAATLRERNPRLVYCSVTGYGPEGPDALHKAYDPMVQAATGLMSISGDPDGVPMKAGTALSDMIAGTYAALGVLAALLERERSDEGQIVDVSMADCLLSMILDEPLDAYETLGMVPRQGNRIMRFSPCNTYRVQDGWVSLAVATEDDWHALLELMGQTHLVDDPEWSQLAWRIVHNDAVDAWLGAWLAPQTGEAALRGLLAAGLACAPVRDIRQVLEWPHLRERGLLQPVLDPEGRPTPAVAADFPLRFSRSDTRLRAPAPRSGQDTEAVLRESLGVPPERLAALRARGVV